MFLTVWFISGLIGYRGVAGRLGVAGAVTGLALWLEPVSSNLSLGQVNALLMLLVVADLAAPDRIRFKGAGIGVATACKLVPGIFVVYLVLTRRFRAAAVAAGAFVAMTLAGWVVAPRASDAFWLHGLFLDPSRVAAATGPAFVANQSVRGFLLRSFGDTAGAAAMWVLSALVITVAGLALALLAHRRGEEAVAVVTVAFTALLVSPVSWSHHWVWVAVLLPVLLDVVLRTDGRVQTVAAGLLPAWTLMLLTWPLPRGRTSRPARTASSGSPTCRASRCTGSARTCTSRPSWARCCSRPGGCGTISTPDSRRGPSPARGRRRPSTSTCRAHLTSRIRHGRSATRPPVLVRAVGAPLRLTAAPVGARLPRRTMQPHDLLARVVEHLPVGVFAFSGDGRVLLWNSRAERLTGWERARVARDGLAGLPLDAPTVRRIRDELLAGRPFRGRIPADVESGATLYFRAEPVPDPEGPILVGVLQEVDDTRAGDEAFALLDALWETAPVGLAFFDSELRYRRVNGAILDTAGGTVDERLGRTPEAVHGPVGARDRRRPARGARRRPVPVRRPRARPALARSRPAAGVAALLLPGALPGRRRSSASALVVVDVTAAARTRREVDALAAERERALIRYQGLVEATSAAVWIREPDGSAVHDSPALRAITGQGVEEYRGLGLPRRGRPDAPRRRARRLAPGDRGRRGGRHLHLPAVHRRAATAGSAPARCRCASPGWSSSGWAPTPTSTTRSAPASGSPCSPGRRAPWAPCTSRRRS